MLASKSRATSSVLKSEKKSLFRFLALYISMIIFLITLLSVFYYQSKEKLLLAEHRATLSKYAYIQTKRLKVLHHYFDERTTYPRDPRFKSAIYDVEKVKIFSTLEDKLLHFDEEVYITKDKMHIHFVKSLDEYYLGTKYLIIEIEDDGIWRNDIWKNIIGYGIVSFLIFMLFGLFLAKLFVKPMRDSIVLLDRFIKDTTHELNTPLSAILANIEMMDTEAMIDKNKKKLMRISIAAKTVSTLYRDLTYLILEKDKRDEAKDILLKPILENRIEYFDILAKSKNITFTLSLQNTTIFIDREKIIRIIDNLISNAIKYNKRGGKIEILLQENKLVIIDTGIGIAKEKIPYMFDRYARFNNIEGGFGVGLSIVKQIVDEYSLTIEVQSEEGRGTKVSLKW